MVCISHSHPSGRTLPSVPCISRGCLHQEQRSLLEVLSAPRISDTNLYQRSPRLLRAYAGSPLHNTKSSRAVRRFVRSVLATISSGTCEYCRSVQRSLPTIVSCSCCVSVIVTEPPHVGHFASLTSLHRGTPRPP